MAALTLLVLLSHTHQVGANKAKYHVASISIYRKLADQVNAAVSAAEKNGSAATPISGANIAMREMRDIVCSP